VTNEGEVIGGRLDADTIELRLSAGQITRIPLSQVTRLGYRRRPDDVDPGDWSFENKPTAYLRGGERLNVQLASPDFALATPIGALNLAPRFISSIAFQGEHSIPAVTLRDGSRISALLPAAAYEASLPGLGVPAAPFATLAQRPQSIQRVRLPSAALLRLAFSPQPEVDDLAPRLTLSNQDELVGSLIGVLTLHTAFDTIKIEGQQIKRLAPAGNKGSGGGQDVQITLWDDSTLSGRLAESHLTCELRCGLIVKAPVALTAQYLQPLPQTSDSMAKRIRAIVRELDADDWHTRDRAHGRILSIGPPAISILKQLRSGCHPEGRQRIDLILQNLTMQLQGPESGQASPHVADVDGNPHFFR
jgi:hypothetical protein